MRTLFFCDLDRTLMYSTKRITSTDKLIVSEQKEGKSISYVHQCVAPLLDELQENGVVFVPSTTRSAMHYNRVDLGQRFDYAIIDNGARILHQGNPMVAFDEEISKELHAGEHKTMGGVLANAACKRGELRDIDGYFYMFKIDDRNAAEKEIAQAIGGCRNWYIATSDTKCYVIPRCVTKQRAMLSLARTLEPALTIAAGDSKLDCGMLNSADISYSPIGSGISADFSFEWSPEGAVAMLNDVLHEVLKRRSA